MTSLESAMDPRNRLRSGNGELGEAYGHHAYDSLGRMLRQVQTESSALADRVQVRTARGCCCCCCYGAAEVPGARVANVATIVLVLLILMLVLCWLCSWCYVLSCVLVLLEVLLGATKCC